MQATDLYEITANSAESFSEANEETLYSNLKGSLHNSVVMNRRSPVHLLLSFILKNNRVLFCPDLIMKKASHNFQSHVHIRILLV